jgi:hypothetical protein
LRTIVVRGGLVIVEALKLQLQLSFAFASGLDLGTLSSKTGFLLLCFSLCGLSPSFLLLFLDLTLPDLVF